MTRDGISLRAGDGVASGAKPPGGTETGATYARVAGLPIAIERCELLPRLPYGLGMLYLFLVGIPMQIVAAMITLSDGVLYPWYAAAPRTWGLSPLEDQQLGGLLMWVPGNLYLFAAIGVLFFVWARESK